MACHTFDASKDELDHGIEYEEGEGQYWIKTVSAKGAERRIYFCKKTPPKRKNALTLLCGDISKEEKIVTATDGDIAMIHIHGAHEVKSLSGELVRIIGVKIAIAIPVFLSINPQKKAYTI